MNIGIEWQHDGIDFIMEYGGNRICGPQTIARLVQITPISLWFMVLVTKAIGDYTPT